MSKTNCINCGHGKDPDAIKCPFCGTTYLDFSSVDFESGTPCVLTIKAPGINGLIQMIARPSIASIELSHDASVVCDIDFDCSRPKFYVSEPTINTSIQFRGV